MSLGAMLLMLVSASNIMPFQYLRVPLPPLIDGLETLDKSRHPGETSLSD